MASFERVFEKHKLSTELIQRFGITDGLSCLKALHYLNACGHCSANSLRSLAKDCLKFYAIEKDLLEKYVKFYINDCSPHLKSAYILFPLFLQRVPETISTNEDILKSIQWINSGILTGDSVSSVVFRCCVSTIERALHSNFTTPFIKDCFLNDDFYVRKQWINALKSFGSKNKKKLIDEIKTFDDKYGDFSDDQLFDCLLTNNASNEHQNNGNDDEHQDNDFSDSDFGDDEVVSVEAEINIKELCDEFSSKLNLLTNCNEVFTMAEVIKRLSYQSLDLTENGFEITKMPRNTIRKFYKFMKELVKTESQFDDIEHFKRLLIIQLATHSKKIIDFCQSHLDNYAKRLQTYDYKEVHRFFWLHFLKNPSLFRPYAVSSALTVLCQRTQMDILEVTTKICQLSKENKSKSLDNKFDIILCAVLDKNYGFEIDLRSVYNLLLRYSCFNWYKTWRSVFDALFRNVHCPLPIGYFQFCDEDLLSNAVAQLDIIVKRKMPLIERLEILQVSMLLLERVYFIGPLEFEKDLWPKKKIEEMLKLLKVIRSDFCPAYSFMKRIDEICSRFDSVIV